MSSFTMLKALHSVAYAVFVHSAIDCLSSDLNGDKMIALCVCVKYARQIHTAILR